MSDTDRRIKEDAIARRRAVSALNFFGIKIPFGNKEMKKKRVYKFNVAVMHGESC